MKITRWLVLVLALFAAQLALAEGLRAPGASTPDALRLGDSAPATVRTGRSGLVGPDGDFIVVVVNTEPITNQQLRAEVARVRRQLEGQKQQIPDEREVYRQVLNQMINDRAQLQLAKETGIKVDDPSVDQAEKNLAAQNKITVEQMRRDLDQEGVDRVKFRDNLRDQILLARLREREVDSKVKVTDPEIDQYMDEQREQSGNPTAQLINMAQILIAVPDGAPDDQLAQLRAKADQVLQRARAGEDFSALAREFSDAADRANGGVLGLRTSDRYPTLFVDAVRGVQPGTVVGPVRSGAGFHILKLMEQRLAGMPPTVVTQTHARHILLKPGAQLTEAQARDRLEDYRRRILDGREDFATLARLNSQDGSAAGGGDLGWATPGSFVPEFERVMDQLAPGEISEPLISRFGVHLIQVIERRNATLTEREQREMIRNRLRQKKYAEALENWVREVRAHAYVEFRDAPWQ